MMGTIVILILIAFPIALARRSPYCFNVAMGWDLLLSAYTGGRTGESLSGRAGTAYAQGKLRGRIFAPIINLLAWNRRHCAEAVLGDLKRAEAVIADDTRPV